jgi:carbamoyltransferase
MRTEMDHLVLGSRIHDKGEQPAWPEGEEWREDYVLD